MNKSEGTAFLLHKQQEIEEENWGCQFWEDLTDQQIFSWPYLVAGLPGGLDVLRNGVELFAIVWVGREWQQPALFIRQADGEEAVLFMNQKQVWNHEAVDAVLWC